jgi:hypothetical protein
MPAPTSSTLSSVRRAAASPRQQHPRRPSYAATMVSPPLAMGVLLAELSVDQVLEATAGHFPSRLTPKCGRHRPATRRAGAPSPTGRTDKKSTQLECNRHPEVHTV